MQRDPDGGHEGECSEGRNGHCHGRQRRADDRGDQAATTKGACHTQAERHVGEQVERGAAAEADGGIEVGFHGEYREIVPNERIVSTEVFEGLPEGVSEEEGATVNTATFVEADGHTTVTILVQAANKVSRDAIIESGMEGGLQDAMDILEQVAVSLR